MITQELFDCIAARLGSACDKMEKYFEAEAKLGMEGEDVVFELWSLFDSVAEVSDEMIGYATATPPKIKIELHELRDYWMAQDVQG